MATVTIWDAATIIKHEDEEATIPPDNHFVLYTIAQEPTDYELHRATPSSSSSAPQRRAQRIAAPKDPYPPPIFPATRFRLPLPSGNDPSFRHEVRVDGKLGLQLSTCCSAGDDIDPRRVLGTILHKVENAGASMDHLCYGQYVWVERAYFPNEKGVRDDKRAIPKHQIGRSVTHASILALMIEKQYKHWCELSLWDEVSLEPLLGSAAFWAEGSRVGWDALYIVAIRRHQSRAPDGSVRWFPELEMRVTC